MSLTKLVSGGQTGADRGALEAARAAGLPLGGWVPRGRLAEDGRVPEHFAGLVETASDDPAERTRLNVRDSDGTLILSHGPLVGGSALTRTVAAELGRPCLWLDLSASAREAAVESARAWVEREHIAVLNVAGPRASEDAEVERAAFAIVSRLIALVRA